MRITVTAALAAVVSCVGVQPGSQLGPGRLPAAGMGETVVGPQGCVCLEAASQCALAAASLRASNAVIAAFPAVGRGDGPENEVGSVNIEPNYAN